MVNSFRDGAFLRGAAGALIVALVLGSGYWLFQRYSEFVVMRNVVAHIIQNSQQQQAAKPTPEAPK